MAEEARWVKQSDIRVEADCDQPTFMQESAPATWTATIDDPTYAFIAAKATHRREWITVSGHGASRQDALKNLTDILRENGVEIVRDA